MISRSDAAEILPFALRASAVLPVEIWHHCWTTFLNSSDKYHLKQPSLVCALFCQICQPILFRKLTFNIIFPVTDEMLSGHWKENLIDVLNNAIRFLELADTKHIPPMVRELQLYTNTADLYVLPEQLDIIPSDLDIDKVRKSVKDAFAKITCRLPAFIKITRLFLLGVDISPVFRRALGALPKLRELRCENCEVTANDGPFMDLETFYWVGWIDCAYMYSCSSLTSPVHLKNLTIDRPGAQSDTSSPDSTV